LLLISVTPKISSKDFTGAKGAKCSRMNMYSWMKQKRRDLFTGLLRFPLNDKNNPVNSEEHAFHY
ncbi:MAG: hypothetical protein AAFU67_10410, partial [Bacteroidota bacterium]